MSYLFALRLKGVSTILTVIIKKVIVISNLCISAVVRTSRTTQRSAYNTFIRSHFNNKGGHHISNIFALKVTVIRHRCILQLLVRVVSIINRPLNLSRITNKQVIKYNFFQNLYLNYCMHIFDLNEIHYTCGVHDKRTCAFWHSILLSPAFFNHAHDRDFNSLYKHD